MMFTTENILVEYQHHDPIGIRLKEINSYITITKILNPSTNSKLRVGDILHVCNNENIYKNDFDNVIRVLRERPLKLSFLREDTNPPPPPPQESDDDDIAYCCYPQLVEVPLNFIKHKFRKEEITRRRRRGVETPNQFIEYKLRKDYYIVMPYNQCKIFSRKSGTTKKKWIRGTGEQIELILSNGTSKNFTKTHAIVSACMGYLDANDEVEHIDQNRHNNELHNLCWITKPENTRRSHKFSSKERRKRTASAMSRPVIRKDLKTGLTVRFPSSNEAARNTEGANQGHISACCNGRQKSHPRGMYQWEYVQQSRREPPPGYTRKDIYFKDLSDEQKNLALSLVSNTRRDNNKPMPPPRAVSNLGEVQTNRGKWTIGSTQSRSHAKKRRYNGINIATWVYIFHHGVFDPAKEQMNHCDGNENDPERFSRYTYLQEDNTYSNFAGTMYPGTKKENMEDLAHARRRRKRRKRSREWESGKEERMRKLEQLLDPSMSEWESRREERSARIEELLYPASQQTKMMRY
jgi:hypothetical protein